MSNLLLKREEYLGKKIYVNLNRIEKIEKYMGICKDFKKGSNVREVSEKWKISRDYARKIRGRYMDMWDKYCQKR